MTRKTSNQQFLKSAEIYESNYRESGELFWLNMAAFDYWQANEYEKAVEFYLEGIDTCIEALEGSDSWDTYQNYLAASQLVERTRDVLDDLIEDTNHGFTEGINERLEKFGQRLGEVGERFEVNEIPAVYLSHPQSNLRYDLASASSPEDLEHLAIIHGEGFLSEWAEKQLIEERDKEHRLSDFEASN